MSSSENSADPKVWGPALWKFLHSMAANYPQKPNPQYRASSRQFFYSLRHLLPCETCRVHYSALLSRRQPQTESAHALQEWVLWLHNEVNRRIKPDKPTWTMEQVKATYKPDANSNQNPTSHLTAHPFQTQMNTPMLMNETNQEYKNIMRPLDDFHSMMFKSSNQGLTLPDSKTQSLDSSQKLQVEITGVSQGQGTPQDGHQLFSSESLSVNPQFYPPSPVIQTSEALVSVQQEPLQSLESLPPPPVNKFTSNRQRPNHRNPFHSNRKLVKNNQKKRPFSARSNASRFVQNRTKTNHQPHNPVTSQPSSDCKDQNEKKDCGCGNK
jgi:FAD-linked sulfhydryl oxidase